MQWGSVWSGTPTTREEPHAYVSRQIRCARHRGTLRFRPPGFPRALSGHSNYCLGSNPQEWRLGVAQYAKVVYENVYPGIDLVFHGSTESQLEYDLIVHPGANASAVQFRCSGAEAAALDGNELVLTTAAGEVRQPAPVLYQESKGSRVPVAV